MEVLREHRDGIAFAAGIGLPIVVCAVLVPFRASFAATASALVLVAVVVAVAANGSRAAGFVAAVSASLWFDFFLTEPYERFSITHRPDIETAVSLFVVGLAVTELAARNRHHHERADENSDHIELVYGLGQLVAAGTSSERVIEQACAELTELLHLRSCRFETEPTTDRSAHLERDGSVRLGMIGWGAHQMGLPGKEVELLVHGDGHVLGCFLLAPTPGWPVSVHRRLVAVAIADQVGSSIAARSNIA